MAAKIATMAAKAAMATKAATTTTTAIHKYKTTIHTPTTIAAHMAIARTSNGSRMGAAKLVQTRAMEKTNEMENKQERWKTFQQATNRTRKET